MHTLNAAIREHLSSTFKQWKCQEPGVKQLILGWIMMPTGQCAHARCLTLG